MCLVNSWVPVRFIYGGVNHIFHLPQRLPHYVDVGDFKEIHLYIWVETLTFKPPIFCLQVLDTSGEARKEGLGRERTISVKKNGGGQGKRESWSVLVSPRSTLLVIATLHCRASKMASLWDWALASMIIWRRRSSSLQRRSEGPTNGWLQRTMVAWVSGWIQDKTCKNRRTS